MDFQLLNIHDILNNVEAFYKQFSDFVKNW